MRWSVYFVFDKCSGDNINNSKEVNRTAFDNQINRRENNVILETIIAKKPSLIVTIAVDASIAEAVRLLSQHGIGALIVSSDSNSIDGMLSERDIVRSLPNFDHDTMSLQVRELMTANVHTCSMETTVAELMSLMSMHHIRHVPVLRNGQLSGMVSIGDVVSARLDELELERKHIHEYITG